VTIVQQQKKLKKKKKQFSLPERLACSNKKPFTDLLMIEKKIVFPFAPQNG